MAITINDNYCLQTMNKAFDSRYLNIDKPWASCSEAISGIPTYRYTGLTINIDGNEYWWKEGINDEDLQLKTLGGTSNLTGATNGLQLLNSNTKIGLGGNLTQDTTICGAYKFNLGDSTSGLTAISGVTPIFNIQDEGGYSRINFIHNQDTPHYEVNLCGDNSGYKSNINLNVNCFNTNIIPNVTCSSSLSILSTSADTAIYNVNSINSDMCYIKEACIASSKLSCEGIINKSTSSENIKTVMNYDDRTYSFINNDSTMLSILSGGTARYGSQVSISNNCDLTHKYYVDNAVSGITANNGLTRDGSVISLGGSLTGNTIISGETHDMTLGSTYSPFDNFYVNANSSICSQVGTSSYSYYNMDCCHIDLTSYDSSGSGFTSICIESASIGAGGIAVSVDNTSNVMYYTDNYCSKFTARSIPDAAWVTGQTTTTGIQNAENGLSKSGTTVVLGGDLTGNTTIGGLNTHNLTFNNISTLSLCSDNANICATSGATLRTANFILHDNISNAMDIKSNCKKLIDTSNSEGYVYDANYCEKGKLNPRWIPDNAYVTGLTSGDATTASNGLCLVDKDIKLGGTLCENTNICLGGLNTYNLSIGNSGITTCSIGEFKPTSINLCVSSVNSPNESGKLLLDKDNLVISNGFSNCNSCISLSKSEIKIGICGAENFASFVVTDNTSTPKGIEYATDYSNTFSECSLITRKYVDDNSNVINVCHVNSGYTTVRTDEFVGVSGLSNNEICLYASPVLGQRVTITDVCGNAFVEPIIINGNGNNINDTVCSIINTDYGSVTYVYNGFFWSATAFIN